tara:strand:- start:80 stop:685 length:606 start_codon:yes stop_codon:yes gene_type:complete
MINDRLHIIDNFLSPKEADLVEFTLGRNSRTDAFPWYCSKIDMDTKELDNFQFVHSFYKSLSMEKKDNGKYNNLLNLFLFKILPFALVRIKANLVPRTPKIKKHALHVDYPFLQPNLQTGIYYVNDNNGYTEFEDGTKVDSVKGRFIVFPTSMKHTGTTCTNKVYRCVINFNFIANLEPSCPLNQLILNQLTKEEKINPTK